MRVVIRTHVLAPQFEALAARHGVEAVPSATPMRCGASSRMPTRSGPGLRSTTQSSWRCSRGTGRGCAGCSCRRWATTPSSCTASRAGVTVTTAGDAYAPTVAEHAVTLLLALVRRLPESVRNAEQHRWDQSGAPAIGTLHDATVAVVGFGNIGREIAARLRGFGARIIAVTRSGRPDPLADELVPADRTARRARAQRRRRARGAAQRADAASHRRARARRDATARAPDQHRSRRRRGSSCAATALADGNFGGAGLDVTDPEPLPPDDPLWSLPNALITPHVAGYGGDVAPRRILALVERNLRAFIEGRPLESPAPVEPC